VGNMCSTAPVDDERPVTLHDDGPRTRIIDTGWRISSRKGSVLVAPAVGTAADGSGGGFRSGGVFIVAMVLSYFDYEKNGKLGTFFRIRRIIVVCAHKIISSNVMNDLGICTSTNSRVLFRSVTSELV